MLSTSRAIIPASEPRALDLAAATATTFDFPLSPSPPTGESLNRNDDDDSYIKTAIQGTYIGVITAILLFICIYHLCKCCIRRRRQRYEDEDEDE
ncbi:hypothetical protein RRF57_012539 [Xylaria bambusicola]|uniref:Uncharacterized protein n=1 Tax=Xylaria bambusicola TaxID=326684 RepID=A0AAN7ZB03_9PEZI